MRKKQEKRRWETGEIRIFNKFCGRKTAGQIAKMLKRTESAVRQRACKEEKSMRV